MATVVISVKSLIVLLLCNLLSASAKTGKDRFYPKPLALSESYSCCVYKSRAERDLDCEEEDRECVDEYQAQMDKYYISSLVMVVVSLIVILTWCIRSRCR